MHVSEIFTHNSYPEYTYVERETKGLEADLENALRVPGGIVSLSGPSKSGKTMLVKRVAKQSHINQMAVVNGSNIHSQDDLWREALENIGEPTTTERHTSETDEDTTTYKGGVNTVVKAGADKQSRSSETEGSVEVDNRQGLSKLIEVVNTDKFVLLIDDFHYIERQTQPKIAEAIKAGAERGLSICVALVGYRGENLEKVNDDLTNRVRSIELDYWREQELREIATIGFSVLNVEVPETLVDTLVREAAGSPLLMQLLCYSTCLQKGIQGPQDDPVVVEINESDRDGIFREAISWGGYSDVVEAIYEGATTRGEGRKMYELTGTKEGDYYECCLRAIAANPPEFSFSRDGLYQRVKSECKSEHPQSNQVSLFCEHMEKLTEQERPAAQLVNWDEEEDTLHISEPGLLFNIRWAIRLDMV